MEFILFLIAGAALIYGLLRLFGKKPRDVVEEIKSDLKDLGE